MLVDPESFALAQHFLDTEGADKQVQSLAETIQTAVEDWFTLQQIEQGDGPDVLLSVSGEDVIERGRRVCDRLAVRTYDPDMEEAGWAIAALSRELRNLRGASEDGSQGT